MKTSKKLIPKNEEGKSVDIEKCVIEQTEDEAIRTYKQACKRLQHPNGWHNMPGFKGASFALAKTNAEEVALNDHIAIDIPGPGPANGNGKDWVQVKSLDENFDEKVDESFGITLKASTNPADGNNGVTAHFFKDMATSTFIIRRKKNKVTASYHGRNEVPNIEYTKLQDKIRNAVVSLAALAGFSEIQWTLFLNGLLRTE